MRRLTSFPEIGFLLNSQSPLDRARHLASVLRLSPSTQDLCMARDARYHLSLHCASEITQDS